MSRKLLLIALAATSLSAAGPACWSADLWGGSVGLTSDYFVRGISRSDDRAALQADLHFLSASGCLAGVFASTARMDPGRGTDAELNAFVGYAWSREDEWHGKGSLGHYAYPGGVKGVNYDYDELDVDLAYGEWADISIVYSPDFPRFVPYQHWIRDASTSLELNLQHAVYRKLVATAGVGYSYQNGFNAAGYVYWSMGAAYDLAPVSLALSYVDTSAAAKALFYDAAARGRWMGTVIWRF